MDNLEYRVALVSDFESSTVRRWLADQLAAPVEDLGADVLLYSLEELTERVARFVQAHPTSICIAVSTSGNGFVIEGNKHSELTVAHAGTGALIREAIFEMGIRVFDLPGHYGHERLLNLARDICVWHEERLGRK